jgi:kumamolisin
VPSTSRPETRIPQTGRSRSTSRSAGSVAPGASIVVYFAPNSARGFVDAVTTTVLDAVRRPTVISISWGLAESKWTAQTIQAMEQAFQTAAAVGVTVCCSSGDDGSRDRVDDGRAHADSPASSPHVLACGGTRLIDTDGAIDNETAWNDDFGDDRWGCQRRLRSPRLADSERGTSVREPRRPDRARSA